MKFSVEVDCTPEEARQFLGLPDLKPMQDSIMSKLEAQMTQAADRFSPEAVLRSWLSLVPNMSDQMREAVEGFLRRVK